MNHSNVLAVCRAARDIAYVEKYHRRTQANLVVASDDVVVQEICGKLPFVKVVTWLEQAESLFAVSDSVALATEAINGWLSSAADVRGGIPKRLVFWLRPVEGGMTTQHIQDVMLLVRSYDWLIHTYNPSKVVLISNPATVWEDSILLETCSTRGVAAEVLGKYRMDVLLARAKYFVRNFLLREPYYIFNILRKRIKGIQPSIPIGTKEVVFQLCRGDKNHIQNIVPIMAELQKKDYEPVALCWTAAGGADEVRKANIRVAELEGYVPVKGLWQGALRAYKTWKAIESQRKSLFTDPALIYNGVPMGALLWPSMKYHIFAELPQRYRLDLALREYLNSHSPLAIKLWGGGALAESQILLQNIRGNNRPLFMFWFWGFFKDPYERNCEHVDLYLTAGRYQEEYLRGRGIRESKMVSVGMSQYDYVPKLSHEFSPEQSRYILGIPEGFKLYFLYDLNIPYRGYLSSSEHAQLTGFLMKYARAHNEVALIIKPHPVYNSDTLKHFMKTNRSSTNVFFVDKNALTGHAVHSADLLITKSSTIGLEGMLLGCPVVSVVLDKEKEFSIFGEAAESMTTIDDLGLLLARLEKDPDFRRQWSGNLIEKGNSYIKEYLGQRDIPSACLAAAAIDRYIRQDRASGPNFDSVIGARGCVSN